MHLLTTISQISAFPSCPISENNHINFNLNSNFISCISIRFSTHDRNCRNHCLRTNKILCSKILISLKEQESKKISYLIDTCGLSEKRALKVVKYVDFEITKKSDEVLEFFKNHGFSQSQITSIVRQFPNLLSFDPVRTLLPKFEFLKSIGLSRTEIIEVVDATPLVLNRSLKKTLIPSFNRLRNLIKSDERTISLIKWCPFILFEDPGDDNILTLVELVMPDPESTVVLEQDSASSGTNFRRIMDDLKKVGFDPSGMSHTWAIHLLRSVRRSPNWEEKVGILKSFGWSEGEFLLALKKRPSFMAASEDKITRIMDFLINTMGMEASAIARKPELLTRSFEKVIVPRCAIYRLLMEKGLYKQKIRMGLTSFLCLPEIQFLNQVIEEFQVDAPEIKNIYKDKLLYSRLT